MREVAQSLVKPSHDAPAAPPLANGGFAVVEVIGDAWDDEAPLDGQLAPGAAYAVLTLPVNFQLQGSITVFLLPLGLPCRLEKA